MKRILCLMTALAVLGAGCGSDSKTKRELPALASDDPSVTAGSTPLAGDQTPSTGDAGANGSTSVPGKPSATSTKPNTTNPPAPAPPANPNTLNRPKLGDYTYHSKGKATSPFSPAGEEIDADSQVKISAQGDLYTLTTTIEGQTQEVVIRFEPSRVAFVSFKVGAGPQTFSCTFNPPLDIARLPLKPETYPTQHAEGDNCSADLDETVIGRETITVPAGSWDSWKIHQKIVFHFTADGTKFDVASEGDNWYATALGVEVKTVQHQTATYQGGSITSDTTTELVTYP